MIFSAPRPFDLAAALAALAVTPAAQAVDPPAPWHDGDTHVHLQPCDDVPDLTLEEIHLDQQAADLDVVCVQLWNDEHGELEAPEYYAAYAPLVTGDEDPLTQGDPDHVMQLGVEVSNFHAEDFGHCMGLGIDDGNFVNHHYPAPILDFFRQSPGAIAGYAHTRWHEGYDALDADQVKHSGSAMVPADLALGKVDFIEAMGLEPDDAWSVRALHDKLLNAGLRVGLTGGSDSGCTPWKTGDVRCYARIDPGPLTFDAWTAAIRAGRTTVAVGSDLFLDLAVDGVGIGGQVDLDAPGAVSVTASLHAADGADLAGELRIVRDGEVVAAEPYALPSGGVAPHELAVTLDESGWIAAHATANGAVRAQTSAVYVVVANRPICSAKDADYWRDVCQTVVDDIDGYDTGDQTQEILDHLAAAQEVFTALAACDGPPPAGVERYGFSTPACAGPMAIGATGSPAVGAAGFAVTCLNAPPDAAGFLGVSGEPLPDGLPIAGITAFIGPYVPAVLPAQSGGGGYAAVPVDLAAASVGQTVHAQLVWTNPPGCGKVGGLSASDALTLTVQP